MSEQTKVISFQEALNRPPARRVVIAEPELTAAQRWARKVLPFCFFSHAKSAVLTPDAHEASAIGRTFIVPAAQDPPASDVFKPVADEIIARRAELAAQQNQ